MKTNSNFQFVSLTPRNRKPSLIANKRWAAYAAAGAATALVAVTPRKLVSIISTFGIKHSAGPGMVKWPSSLINPGIPSFLTTASSGGCNIAGFFITNVSSMRAGFRGQPVTIIIMFPS